jgi:PPK2 family polyphosphate:nucleotide phosphotransferase
MAKKDAAEKKISKKKQRRRIGELIEPFRVTNGDGFRLKDYDPGSTHGLADRDEAEEYLQRGVELLASMQDKLYAQDQWGVLLIFQAMDAAGKDGAIKHVMSGINPQGCQVYAFKSPTSEELDHDFLWRTSRSLPERGRIGIFNRSYYEETLVVRVHPEILTKQKLPSSLVTKGIWDERYQDIRSFERYLARQGYVIVKFFLNVSRKEQKGRFLERLERPEKNWKFSLADAKERGYWKDYMEAYDDVIRATATRHAPWYVVPADKKWFARLVVAGAIYDALSKLGLRYPVVGPDKKKELAAARNQLLREGKASS